MLILQFSNFAPYYLLVYIKIIVEVLGITNTAMRSHSGVGSIEYFSKSKHYAPKLYYALQRYMCDTVQPGVLQGEQPSTIVVSWMVSVRPV